MVTEKIESNCRCIDILFNIKEKLKEGLEEFFISNLILGRTNEIQRFTPEDFLNLSRLSESNDKIKLMEGPLRFTDNHSTALTENQFSLFENGFVRSFQFKTETDGEISIAGGFPLMLEEYFLLSCNVSINDKYVSIIKEEINSLDFFNISEINKYELIKYNRDFCLYLGHKKYTKIFEHSRISECKIKIDCSKFPGISQAVERIFFHLGTNIFLKKESNSDNQIETIIIPFEKNITAQIISQLKNSDIVTLENLNKVGQILMMINMLKYNHYRINVDPEKEKKEKVEKIPRKIKRKINNIIDMETIESEGLPHFQFNQLMHHAYLNGLIVGENYNYIRGKEIIRKHSTKAAVAAIMARNMSHNIGSHVLNYLSDVGFTEKFVEDISKYLLEKKIPYDKHLKMVKLKDVFFSKFHEHLRERMDLVAAIPTHDPIWTLSVNIKRGITERLCADKGNINKFPELFFLIDNLVRSEGIRAGELEFFINSGIEKQNIEAAIYGGVLGVQCFYVILENFIRNSAKHGSKKSLETIRSAKDKPIDEKKKLKIYIDFYSQSVDEKKFPDDDYILVEIYDNLGGWPKAQENDDEGTGKRKESEVSIHEEIFPKLDPKTPGGALIDDVGRLMEGYWGLKEMRIAASYLRGIPSEDIDNYSPSYDDKVITPQEIIKPFPVKNYYKENFTTLDDKDSLGYRFLLNKPKSILIISDNEDIKEILIPQEEFKAEGIDIVKCDNLKSTVSSFPHEYFILDMRGEKPAHLDFFKKNNLFFPIKTLFIYDNNPDSLIDNLKEYFRRKELIPELLLQIEDLKEYTWLKRLATESNLAQKQSVKKLYEELFITSSKKFKLNIQAKWNNLLNLDTFNINIFQQEYIGDKNEALTNGSYTISFVHPPLTHYDSYAHEIKGSNFVGLFSKGISNMFKKFYESFEELGNSNFNIGSFYLLLKAFEISSYNFVILDERLFKYQEKFKPIVKEKNIQSGKFWHFQNVIFLDMEKENGDTVISYYPFNWQENWNGIQCPVVGVIAKPVKSKEINLGDIFPEWFKRRMHVMIVHIGIIEKIGGKDKFEEWLNSLDKDYRPWFLLIDSGRGHPESDKLPKNTRFQDFSNLRKYIIEEPDKYILSSVLLNARK